MQFEEAKQESVPNTSGILALSNQEFKIMTRDFSGYPVVKTLSFHCKGYRFHLWSLGL